MSVLDGPSGPYASACESAQALKPDTSLWNANPLGPYTLPALESFVLHLSRVDTSQ